MSDTATAEVKEEKKDVVNGGLTEKQLQARREVPWTLIPKTIWNFMVKYTFDKPLEGVQWAGRKIDDAGRSPKMRQGFGAILGLPVGIMLRNTGRAMYHMAKGDYARSHWVGAFLGGAAGWAGAAVGLASLGGVTSVGAIATGGLLATAAHVAVVAASAAAAVMVIPTTAMIGAVALTAVVTGVTAGLSIFPALVPNSVVGALRTWDRIRGIKGVDYDGPKEHKKIDYDSIREIEERERYSDVSWKVSTLSEVHQKEIYDNLGKQFARAAAAKAEEQDNAAPAAPVPVAQPAAKDGITVSP